MFSGYVSHGDRGLVVRDGWLHTGDRGHLAPDGAVVFDDVIKPMFTRNGFNIYPREIEDVLFTHPAVYEAAVCGVPDAYRGETVKAFVVLKEGAHASEQEIIAYCRQHLAAFKAPRAVEIRAALPKSTVGKVLRRVLAEDALRAQRSEAS